LCATRVHDSDAICNFAVMGKISHDDKMRIQTLREQGLGPTLIQKAYPEKRWSLGTLKTICERVDKTGSAVERRKGSGRPKSARNDENIAKVAEMICSQEDRPGTSKSTRDIAREVGTSQTSVQRIASRDLGLNCFKRVPVQVLTGATKQKRLERCTTLLRRFSVKKTKTVFFTDEKLFYLSPPVNTHNNPVWSAGLKSGIDPKRLLVQRAKFSAHVMVSAGVCFSGKGRLHFVDDKAKINADYYVNSLLPKLVEDCETLMPDGYTFQQDGAPAHTSRHAQEWLAQQTPDFVNKDEWPPNSPDLNPLDYYVWGAMLHKYQRFVPKPTNVAELRGVLEVIWDDLPHESIQKAVLAFRKRLQACCQSEGGHFEHLLRP
jgi:AraC-like DNA-binding protein